MAQVNPPTYLKTPAQFKADNKLGPYFEQLEFILFQLWTRANKQQVEIDNLKFTVVEADETYQVLVHDDAINCDGTFTVTFADIADTVGSIIVTSTNGTITVAGDAPIQGSTSLTTGTSAEWYPARDEWWRR